MTLAKFAAAILIAAGLSAPSLAADLKVGVTPTTYTAPALIAKQKGWLEEELVKAGVKDTRVQWASFVAGPPMNESLASGKIDFALFGVTPSLIGRAAGVQAHVVALASSGFKQQAAAVLPNSSIKSVKDFKGKKVATFKGTTAHQLLVLAFKAANLSLSDVEFINLSPADLVPALQSGNVDAAFLIEPALSNLETNNAIRIIPDGTGLMNVVCVIEVPDAYLAKHREEVKAFLKAYDRASAFIRANPDEAARILTAEINLPAAVIRRSLDKFAFSTDLSSVEFADFMASEAFLREQNLIRTSVDVNEFIDLSVLRELQVKK